MIYRYNSSLTFFLWSIISFTLITSCGEEKSNEDKSKKADEIDILQPVIIDHSPKKNSNNITLTETITVRFSEDILNTSIDNDSFHLKKGLTKIPTKVDFNELTNTATLIPKTPLSLLSEYQVFLTDMITDLSGNSLPPISWSFTTRDGKWGKPLLIEDNNFGDSYQSSIATGNNSDFVIAWEQYNNNSGEQTIWTKVFTSGKWDEKNVISGTKKGIYARKPQVVINKNNDIIATWEQTTESEFLSEIWENRFIQGKWQQPRKLSQGTKGSVRDHTLVTSADGTSFLVWSENDGKRDNILASWHSPSTDWSTIEFIETDNSEDAHKPVIAVDDNGYAVVVWQQGKAGIWANRFNPEKGKGWGIASNIGKGKNPDVSINTSGKIVAVWHLFNGLQSNIFSNTYNKKTGWNGQKIVRTPGLTSKNARVIVNNDNSIFICWYGSYSENTGNPKGEGFDLWGISYSPELAWGLPKKLSSLPNKMTSDSFFDNHKLHSDNENNIIVSWVQRNGEAVTVMTNRFNLDSGWDLYPSKAILSDSQKNSFLHDLSIAIDGSAMAIWSQNDAINEEDNGDYNIYINQFK